MKNDTSSNQGGISRRDLFKLGSVAALGVAGTSVLAGCGSPKTAATSGDAAVTAASGTPSFLVAPAAITDIKETKEYDVVVVGAGAAGVPAALSASELGAKVAVLQKESQAIAQGNTGTGIDLAKSSPAGVEALVSRLSKDCQHRSSRALLEVWAQNSGEAVSWVINRSLEGGASVVDQGNAQAAAVTTVNGYALSYVTSFFGPKPLTAGDGMRALADVATKEGVEFFYSTPAVQLVKDGDKVIGVIGKNADGTYTQFNAAKGVILATG
ncbi:MAG: FAD-dependent oxidoreductase, partial [Actinobacteria bacterium]|nr:FAD-dependent oxidoreductase [Actinomycetota bacterium]